MGLRSGMLPGYVAGHYGYDACHVDLAKLTAFAQARLINAEATGIDTQVTSPGHVYIDLAPLASCLAEMVSLRHHQVGQMV